MRKQLLKLDDDHDAPCWPLARGASNISDNCVPVQLISRQIWTLFALWFCTVTDWREGDAATVDNNVSPAGGKLGKFTDELTISANTTPNVNINPIREPKKNSFITDTSN